MPSFFPSFSSRDSARPEWPSAPFSVSSHFRATRNGPIHFRPSHSSAFPSPKTTGVFRGENCRPWPRPCCWPSVRSCPFAGPEWPSAAFTIFAIWQHLRRLILDAMNGRNRRFRANGLARVDEKNTVPLPPSFCYYFNCSHFHSKKIYRPLALPFDGHQKMCQQTVPPPPPAFPPPSWSIGRCPPSVPPFLLRVPIPPTFPSIWSIPPPFPFLSPSHPIPPHSSSKSRPSPGNASNLIPMLRWTNQPAELNSPQFVPSLPAPLPPFLLLLPLLLIPSFSSFFSSASGHQMPAETDGTPFNMSELYTKEPNWPIEDFDERKQPKKRKDNQLTSRYGLRIDQCPEGGEPEMDSLNGQVKLCQLDDECRPSYRCQNIIGLTHFGKQMRYCCPTKTTACTEKPKLEPIIPGRCRPLKTFYYFDVDQLACVKARMAQCEDFGRNRFASILECRTKCETTACELGESILLHNGSFDKPFLCGSDEDCPVGYNCRQDGIFRRSICCGFLDFEPCPLGFRSFTVPFSGRPKTCVSSDTRDECPTDYVCTQNQINQEHYCCTVENGVCPEGHQAYIHPLTDGTIKCNLKGYESTTACPPGYACLAAVFGSSWGFCCSQAVVASCPDDSFPQINSLTNQPQRCEMMQPHACAKGFICESDSVSHLGFCCSVPRKYTRKKTHPPELIPRKKTKPTTTTMEPPEEEEKEEEARETAAVAMPTTTTEKAKEQFVVTTTIRGKRKGDWRGKRRRKTKKKEEGRRRAGRRKEKANGEEGEEGRSGEDHGAVPSSSSSASDEKSFEKHELTKLSTKLDRFISGVGRRRTGLPRGHNRPKPRIWKLKKGRGMGQEEMVPLGEEEEEMEEEEERGESEEGKKMVKRRRHSRPRCPSEYRPMAYPGTKWTYLECLAGKAKRKMKKKRRREEEESEVEEEGDEREEEEAEEDDEEVEARSNSAICPKPAKCLRAKNDPFRRALCCLRKVEEDEVEEEEEEDAEDGDRSDEREEGEGKRKKKKKKGKEEEEERGEEEGEEDEEGDEKEEETEREKMTEELAKIKEKEAEAEASVRGGKKARTKAQTSETGGQIQLATTTIMTTTTTKGAVHHGGGNGVVLMVEKSNDAACPRLIADRICVPGSTRDCKEHGFFCQFNKEKRQFVCCSKK